MANSLGKVCPQLFQLLSNHSGSLIACRQSCFRHGLVMKQLLHMNLIRVTSLLMTLNTHSLHHGNSSKKVQLRIGRGLRNTYWTTKLFLELQFHHHAQSKPVMKQRIAVMIYRKYRLLQLMKEKKQRKNSRKEKKQNWIVLPLPKRNLEKEKKLYQGWLKKSN